MKLGAEDKKKLPILIVVGLGGIGAVIWTYTQLSTPTPPPPAPPVVLTGPSRLAAAPASPEMVGEMRQAGVRPALGGGPGHPAMGSAQYDPTLKMEAMLVTESLMYTGSGRNIFSPNSAPSAVTAIPVAKFPARPVMTAQTIAVPTGPPPPPPIDLKFFGTDTAKGGARQAFLLHGEDVYVASTGDVVQRRYKVGAISANNIVVEDLTNSNTQTLPLLVQ